MWNTIIGGKKNFTLHLMTNYFPTFYFLVAGFFSTSDYCKTLFHLTILVSFSHVLVSNKIWNTIIGGNSTLDDKLFIFILPIIVLDILSNILNLLSELS
jgi:hypothetical protein